jgi:hypothetical protein
LLRTVAREGSWAGFDLESDRWADGRVLALCVAGALPPTTNATKS